MILKLFTNFNFTGKIGLTEKNYGVFKGTVA